MNDIYVSGPSLIQIDGADVGRTVGPTTITRNATYEDVKRQDSPHAFKVVKKNIAYEVRFDVTTHTLKTIALGFDVSETGYAINYEDTGVQEHTLTITTDVETYTFARVVQVGTAGIPYDNEGVTVIPLILKVLLIAEDAGDTVPGLCTLDSHDLPGQFNYRINRPKRSSIMDTFGGIRQNIAPAIYDELIEFQAVNLTLAQKNTIEGIYEGTFASSVLFTGIHSEAYSVWFEKWDAPTEEDGFWSVSGVLRVDQSGGT